VTRELGARAWRRVAIVGASATGKSVLGAELAATLGVPHVKLDDLRWPAGVTATDDQFAHALDAATQRPGWVLEGAEASGPVQSAWRQADALVWLDHNRIGVCLRMLMTTEWWERLPPNRRGYLAYLIRKSKKSWHQAAALRRDLPRVLARLPAGGVEIIRLPSVRATERWRRRCARRAER
jgi:adenylate kinase family enzyme